MKRFYQLLSLCLAFFLSVPSTSDAQIKRGEWDFCPVSTTTNSLYGLLLNGLGVGSQLPWFPNVFNRFSVMQSIDTPNGKADVKYWDWELRNIAVAYQVAYQSKLTPFGASFRVGYEKRGLRTTLPDESKQYFNRQMINPTLMLQLRFGDYIGNRINPIVEIGGSYDFVFACKGLTNDKKSVNSGFHGIAGIGIGDTNTHMQYTIRYEHDFYNWFNEDYTPDGGKTHPYKGWKSKLGYLSISVRYGF